MSITREKSDRRKKTVYTRVSIWYRPKAHSIHLAFKDFGLITTVSEKPGRKRCHPDLYNHLRSILQKEGKWPEEPRVGQ